MASGPHISVEQFIAWIGITTGVPFFTRIELTLSPDAVVIGVESGISSSSVAYARFYELLYGIDDNSLTTRMVSSRGG